MTGLQAAGALLLGEEEQLRGGVAPFRAQQPLSNCQTTILYMPAVHPRKTFSKKLLVYILSSHFMLAAYGLGTFIETSSKRIIAKNSKFKALTWLISHESRNLPGDRGMDWLTFTKSYLSRCCVQSEHSAGMANNRHGQLWCYFPIRLHLQRKPKENQSDGLSLRVGMGQGPADLASSERDCFQPAVSAFLFCLFPTNPLLDRDLFLGKEAKRLLFVFFFPSLWCYQVTKCPSRTGMANL